ncbi:MAG: hypothetical protein ACRD0H_24710 [Actinomycetes bacterium]
MSRRTRRISSRVAAGHQSGHHEATATCAPSMSTASVHPVSGTLPSSRHSGAMRLAPMANSTPASSAARANAPAK